LEVNRKEVEEGEDLDWDGCKIQRGVCGKCRLRDGDLWQLIEKNGRQ